MSKSNVDVPTPSSQQVDYWLNYWETLDNYKIQEEAINELFQIHYKSFTDLKTVIIKCSVLNDFYSTNIFDIYKVARHIITISNVEERLKNDDLSLVGEIAKVNFGTLENKKEKNFYSFASKFCSHHSEECYPIYDSYVDTMLKYFKSQNKLLSFDKSDLKDYFKFKEILIRFKTIYNLENYSLKQIDKYLWQAGKKYFPKNYRKKSKISK